LHGLFGSGKNWNSVGNALKDLGDVYLLDARNHGDSFHASSHSLADMADDLREFIHAMAIENPVLVGHSMGGMAVMLYALLYAEQEMSLVVVDIFPKNHDYDFKNEMEALSVDPAAYASRKEIDQAMARFVPDAFIRQFLQMNLERTPEGKYQWKINLPAIAGRNKLFDVHFTRPVAFAGKTAFIMGENSPYYKPEEEQLARQYFPHAKIHVVSGGGHYIHYTHFQQFVEIVRSEIS